MNDTESPSKPEALPPVSGSDCPVCGGRIKAFHDQRGIGSGRYITVGWSAACQNVRGCQVARNGTTSAAETRKAAIESFIRLASQNASGMGREDETPPHADS